MALNFGPHALALDEGERQMVLMALAHLALERPGWDDALSRIAVKVDNATPAGRPELYDNFKAFKVAIDKR